MQVLRRLFTAVLAAALFSSAACHTGSERRFIIGGRDAGDRGIRVEVINDNYADMGIFVMEGATTFRLGEVVGKSTATFSLNRDQISPSGGLRLLADPIGSRDAYLSDPVVVGEGAIVVLNLAPALSQSFVTLR